MLFIVIGIGASSIEIEWLLLKSDKNHPLW
jgi:hypothetical protein